MIVMVEYDISENSLTIADETINHGVEIDQSIEYDNYLVVRLEANTVDEHDHQYRNVIAYDRDGGVRWKIPRRPATRPGPYTNIHSKNGNDLWAHNSSGMLYEVDPETGDIIGQEFVK